MTAWVFALVVAFGYNAGIAIPNVATLEECVRLGNALNEIAGPPGFRTYKCVGYSTRIAK